MADLKERILKALAYVEDPDLKKDLVTLNMIRNMEIGEGWVKFDLVLTTPACPMKDMLTNACKNAIKTMVDGHMDVQINVTSTVTTAREENEVLKGIRNIIAVASGKGGVGKSTVAVNLAKSLRDTGAKVGILDADIHGPSIPTLLGVTEERPEVVGEKMIPIVKDGIELMSIGFLVPRQQAIVWRGPMLASALKQFSNDVNWSALDYLIVDLPPGTGDVHLSLVQQIPLTGVVMVTKPDEVSVADTRKAIDMFTNPQLKQNILGIVENMSFFKPKDSDTSYFLFGEGGGESLANEFQLELLGKIPVIEPSDIEAKQAAYSEVVGKVAQKVSILNAVS